MGTNYSSEHSFGGSIYRRYRAVITWSTSQTNTEVTINWTATVQMANAYQYGVGISCEGKSSTGVLTSNPGSTFKDVTSISGTKTISRGTTDTTYTLSATAYGVAVSGYGAADNSSVTVYSDAISIPAKPYFQHTISHYLIGFNGENNTLPSNPNHYVLGASSVTIQYGNSININNYVKEIPNGFQPRYMWDGITNYYFDNSYTYTQADSSNTFNYYYFTRDYNITYNLNGGTNNTENPSSYNVLYGVTLKEPTREYYTFTGWTDQDNASISAINEGANAEFNSIDEMYNQLSLRTTGDIALTANWIGNEYTVTLDANGGTSNINTLTVNYDSNINSDISAYLPTRKGYKFLGWYSSATGGTQIYDCNGVCTNEGTYWSDNIYVYAGDLTVYAQWKPLNIAYMKQNGKWVLCNSYVKKNGIWKPAIMKKITKGVD